MSTMSAPEMLRIKRKRDEIAPNELRVEVEGPNKKLREGTATHYVLQKSAQDVERQDTSAPQTGKGKAAGIPGSGLTDVRRVFHLNRPTSTSSSEKGIRKRRVKEDHIATFIEKRAKRNPQELRNTLAEHGRSNIRAPVPAPAPSPAPERALKRPGKGSAVKTPRNVSETYSATRNGQSATVDPHLEAMARSLQRFAAEGEEEEAVSKPKITAVPKLPPHRSRDLHRQRVSSASSKAAEQYVDVDMDADDDADYVYETYVLAPSSHIGAAQVNAQEASGDVGYLVITEEDQAVWESYIEDEPSDKDWNTDEDDENAEDWYGADYPDDELASDDEFDRNAYGYRAGGSDDEAWDEDTGAFSDDEYERQMQPFRNKKTPQQFAKYFDGVRIDGDEQ